ncbi:MAG TPA: LysR family transcriptional regulator [Gaiellaceae bacterium]|jgi:DNA-binding transcriptional LysR family regulator|nr:LysR family transcriptional regulator [Gaiellaceae bacterium]
MRINLAQLRAFVAIVDEASFGAAAETLGITQSAVSHAISSLERTAATPVIVRGTSGPILTSFGTELLKHARVAVAAAEAITDLAAAQAGSPHGVVRLAAPPTVCIGMLPDLVAYWHTEFPRVTVRIFEGEHDEVEEWLDARSVEAAILVDPPPSTRARLVGTDTFHALLRHDHPLANETAINLHDLEDDPLLFSGAGCEQPIQDLYRRAGVKLIPTHRVRELGTLFAMIRCGLGVAIVPSLVRSMLDRSLILVPLCLTHQRRLALTGPPDGLWHPAVSALIASVEPRDY